MSTTYAQEENVCVACKAAVVTQLAFPNGMRLWCCAECADDGSLMKWLVRELEAAITAAGGTFRMENGKKLWTLPEAEEVKHETEPLVSVPKELFDWLTEYAIELEGQWQWKKGSIDRNAREFDELSAHVKQAVELRDK